MYRSARRPIGSPVVSRGPARDRRCGVGIIRDLWIARVTRIAGIPGIARPMGSDSICPAAAGKRRDAERGGDAVNGSVEQR